MIAALPLWMTIEQLDAEVDRSNAVIRRLIATEVRTPYTVEELRRIGFNTPIAEEYRIAKYEYDAALQSAIEVFTSKSTTTA